jgi:hypothetical protein
MRVIRRRKESVSRCQNFRLTITSLKETTGIRSLGRTSYLKLAVAGPDSTPATYSTTMTRRLPILGVRVGPRYATDVEAEIAEVVGLLHQHGYDDVPVDTSRIPFRG